MKMKWKMMPASAVCGWLVAGAMAAAPVWAAPQSAAKTTHPGKTTKKPVTHRAVVHKTPVHKTAKGSFAAAKRPRMEAVPVSRPKDKPDQATMDRVHAWVQEQQKNSGAELDAVAPVKPAAVAPSRIAMPLTPTRAAKPAAGRPMIPAVAPAAPIAPVAEVNKATAADFDKAVEKQTAEKPKLTTGVSQPEDERMTARTPMPVKSAVPADTKPAVQEPKPVMIPTPEPKSAVPETKQLKDIAVVAGKSTAPKQPKLMYVHGRLVVPEPLKGSHEILVHQNEVADREGLSRVEDDEDLNSMRAKKQLVALPVSGALRADERLPRDRRYARPWTVKFLADLARAHYAKFHEAVQVNSAVRTVDVQRHLLATNGNAAPVEGNTASPHLTGEAIDLAKHGMSKTEIAWMRAYLAPLILQGKVDVEEEFEQACFHVSVYQSYAPAPVLKAKKMLTAKKTSWPLAKSTPAALATAIE